MISRRSILVGATGVLLIGGVLLGLMVGDTALSFGELYAAITGTGSGTRAAYLHMVVWEWRTPRVVAAVAFGAGLAASGMVFQTVSANPLGSPDLLGVTGGAAVGASVSILFLGGGFVAVTSGAFVGAVLAIAVVTGFARAGGRWSVRRLIVAGVAMSAFTAAVTSFVMYAAGQQVAYSLASWTAGSLARVDTTSVLMALAVMLPAALIIVLSSRGLRQLELGVETARVTGVPVTAVRFAATSAAVLLAATATSLAGPIPFIALVAPHAVRRFTRSSYTSLWVSMLVGAALLLSADTLAQHGFAVTLPAGVLTALLGGGYLAWLLLARPRIG